MTRFKICILMCSHKAAAEYQNSLLVELELQSHAHVDN